MKRHHSRSSNLSIGSAKRSSYKASGSKNSENVKDLNANPFKQERISIVDESKNEIKTMKSNARSRN